MSVYESYKRKMKVDSCSTGKNYPTLGEKLKSDSDQLMELTWDGDLQSKVAYIYDYFHDDFFTDEHGITRSLASGMTYENTKKTPINIKFIIKSYQSMDKDEVEHYIQFKPSQELSFKDGDDLFYFEKIHARYNSEFPIGAFVDIPDDRGVYHKWLICRKENANQFPKYLVLPANYELMWIEKTGDQRIKRRMWSVLRMQSSYTIGTYTDRYITHVDNQDKIWLPMNDITSKFWYTSEDSKNMRLLVSTLSERPSAWTVTKCENVQPFGIQKLTIYSGFFNEHTDYVNLETGEMYADYFDSNITPTDPDTSYPLTSSITATISASTSTIKVGGSYKTLTVNVFDNSNEDITTKYTNAEFIWTCSIGDEDWTEKVTWRNGTEFNQRKVKFPNDVSMIGKIINVQCTIRTGNTAIQPTTIQLELTE